MRIKFKENQTAEDLICVDVGRPTIFNAEHHKFWTEFHNWVEDTEIEIVTNGIFELMKEYAEGDGGYGGYGGGGFMYCFWFQNQEDADVFKKKWGGWEPELMRYIPVNGMFSANDKTFRFHEEMGSKRYNELLEASEKNIESGIWDIVEYHQGNPFAMESEWKRLIESAEYAKLHGGTDLTNLTREERRNLLIG